MDTQKTFDLLNPVAEAMGYELVRVAMIGQGTQTLQIMAERPDGTMLVEDCEKLSREISTILDVEDPIKGEYYLEVSSPGVDRPLTRQKDFDRYQGFEAKLELKTPHEGQRRYRGLLKGLDEDLVVLEQEGRTVSFPFSEILKAKLILTDELIAAHAKKQDG